MKRIKQKAVSVSAGTLPSGMAIRRESPLSRDRFRVYFTATSGGSGDFSWAVRRCRLVPVVPSICRCYGYRATEKK